jgi:hypothetical protein
MASQPRILILGLGGTGVKALMQLRQMFEERPGGVPPYCRLVGIDTTPPPEATGVSVRGMEFIHLELHDPAAMRDHPSNAYIRDWCSLGINVVSSADGAAQIRPLGRLALHAQPERVISQLRNCIDSLTDRERLREDGNGTSINEHGSVEVYVLASVAGGTGSGIFLDVTRLVREQLKDAPTVRFVGVLLLPGPFRALAGTDLVNGNSYAALKELDHLAAPRDAVDIRFGPDRQLVLDRSPFDLVYLVDSVGELYDTTKTPWHLARQMAFLPYLMATNSIGSHVREVLHNLIPQLQAKELVEGKRATYASFGVAVLELSRSSVLNARRAFQAELVGALLVDSGNGDLLADLGARQALARCVVGRMPERLEMLLDEVNFGNPREPLDKLAEIFAVTVAEVEEYGRRFVHSHIQELRDSGSRVVRDFLQDAATNPGRLCAALRECSRLRADFEALQVSLRTSNAAAGNAERERKRTWDACREAFKSRRRSTREPAANEWKDTVNALVLPTRLLEAITAELTDGIGFLIDRVREAEHWCLAATKHLGDLLAQIAEKSDTNEVSPDPFTRYVDANSIRPRADARKFLAGLPDARSYLGGAPP